MNLDLVTKNMLSQNLASSQTTSKTASACSYDHHQQCHPVPFTPVDHIPVHTNVLPTCIQAQVFTHPSLSTVSHKNGTRVVSTISSCNAQSDYRLVASRCKEHMLLYSEHSWVPECSQQLNPDCKRKVPRCFDIH